MSFRGFLDKYYLGKINYKFSKFYISFLVFGFVFLVFASLLLRNFVVITNDLVQKENIERIDNDFSVDLPDSVRDYLDYLDNQSQTYEEYYREKIVFVPINVYIYLALCLICWLFWVESFINFVFMYYRCVWRKDEKS